MFPLFLKNLSFLPSCLSRKVFTRFQVCGFSSSSSSFPVVSVWWHLDILCLHRNGIFMGDLRAELTKCDLPLVKRFYGHKKFSNFLVSIPHVQLEYLGEGDFGVLASHFEKQPHWDNFKYRVSVWWDFDSCRIPSDISLLNVAPSIMGVLRANGIKGPIHIDVYGDVSQLSMIQ
ncbi:hypothetical protein MTR_1g008900 [Medicago truncatula]|uniref:HTH OST-type domain-containing protein n=1 Tax=Medicago truncatula TaxID=3880 RepID=G7I536_MEDTR|nr:hypothetical protein MTR_1g008900 [Medicago truncatula]